MWLTFRIYISCETSFMFIFTETIVYIILVYQSSQLTDKVNSLGQNLFYSQIAFFEMTVWFENLAEGVCRKTSFFIFHLTLIERSFVFVGKRNSEGKFEWVQNPNYLEIGPELGSKLRRTGPDFFSSSQVRVSLVTWSVFSFFSPSGLLMLQST